MDSLFKRTFDGNRHEHSNPAVEIQHVTYDLKESNVSLKLTIVETVGYGDQIDKGDSTESILKYIDSNYESFLQEEMQIKRTLNTYHDTRVHACLYFIAPTGHSLKSLDLVCMKKLDSKVNKMVKARQYPWGTVQVENENHCDFMKLREMLIRTNMEDLRETTHKTHYELYRRCKLQEMGFQDNESMSL